MPRGGILDRKGEMMRDSYIGLPVDADGVPWGVGDLVREDGGFRAVDGLTLRADGWRLLLEGRATTQDPAGARHFTVETVAGMLDALDVAAMPDADAQAAIDLCAMALRALA